MNYQENVARILNESFQYEDNFFGLMLEDKAKDKADERLAVLSKDVSSMSIFLYISYLKFHADP